MCSSDLQIPYIRRSLEVFRIPILEAEGFEADDVIGTLACKASGEGHEVFIVSGDKDMMQLVTPTVKVLNPQKDNLILDPAKVTETLGVPPEKVVDVMALRGDAVDNIPGAPGIGDKGSVELILEFGSVEAVLDRASEVKRKSYRESLEQNRDAVLLSKELVECGRLVRRPELPGVRGRAPDAGLWDHAIQRAGVPHRRPMVDSVPFDCVGRADPGVLVCGGRPAAAPGPREQGPVERAPGQEIVQ